MLDKSLVDTISGIAYGKPVSVGAGAGFFYIETILPTLPEWLKGVGFDPFKTSICVMILLISD